MNTSPLLGRHEAAGARLATRPEAPDHATVLTFGDVPGEYAAGREGTLLLDATDRGLVRATGSEAASFLHRMLAGPVLGVSVGSGGANLLLTAKGKVRSAFDLRVEEGALLLDAPPGRAGELQAALDGYLFTEDVQLEDRTEEAAPLELLGPGAEALLAGLLGSAAPADLGDHAQRELAGAPLSVARVEVAGSAGWRLDAGPAGVNALWDALVEAGARPGGLVARDSLRVEAGAALFGVDADDETYPQEARWERAFSLTKGCYVGQEVVAKIDTYGGLNKRLCALRLDGDEPVQPGTRLLREADGETRDLGLITSWAYSFELDAGLALGYVKRRHQALGGRFELAEHGGGATIVGLPVRPDALPPTGEFE